jgi:regulator of replication initiation timing
VFIFQFLNEKMHNYVKENTTVNLNIQKLKKKNTFSPKSIQTEKAEESLGKRTKLSQFVYFLWGLSNLAF